MGHWGIAIGTLPPAAKGHCSSSDGPLSPIFLIPFSSSSSESGFLAIFHRPVAVAVPRLFLFFVYCFWPSSDCLLNWAFCLLFSSPSHWIFLAAIDIDNGCGNMSARFNDLLRRAQGAIANFRTGGSGFFLGRNGEVIYSKNNVCIHESAAVAGTDSTIGSEEPVHTPGYLSIHCLDDDQFGVTLVLQWLPNTLLEKNPTSIRCVSPRLVDGNGEIKSGGGGGGVVISRFPCSNRARSNSDEEKEQESALNSSSFGTPAEEEGEEDDERRMMMDSNASTDICGIQELNGCEMGGQRPATLLAIGGGGGSGLSVPSINLIPNTPIEHQSMEDNIRRKSESSGVTSGEDEEEEEEEEGDGKGGHDDQKAPTSSDDEAAGSADEEKAKAKFCSLDALRQSCAASLQLGSIPEQFAREHNLALEAGVEDAIGGDESSRLAMAKERVHFQQQQMANRTADGQEGEKQQKGGGSSNTICSLFSVNLGKMRSMRVFYSDPERTSGQLVIASPDSQYKIFHFHHAGLDKLAELFERWNAVKSKGAGNDSPSIVGPDRHLMICPDGADLAKTEMDPEDGLYEQLSWDHWRSYVSKDGTIEDPITIKKTIFFASMDPSLRKELWPFLLRIFPWSSGHEQREAIRNDLFLRYQRLKRNRIRKVAKATAIGDPFYGSVESSIYKDVVRTDRRNSFFAGDENANLEIMKSILLTYAVRYPEINYIQGMSDLLSPLLCTLRDEPLAYWCFGELMKQTLFCQSKNPNRNVMEVHLDYLRELLKLFTPEFFAHLTQIGGDATNLMFVHRWILLFFKREFPKKDALHVWEACWSNFRTAHFHLFIASAIVSVFGPDVVAQKLPHDEILLYFSSLAMHMDSRLILRKARGLLYQFHRLPKIPCTLVGLLEAAEIESDQWNSHIPVQREFECIHQDQEQQCPFAVE